MKLSLVSITNSTDCPITLHVTSKGKFLEELTLPPGSAKQVDYQFGRGAYPKELSLKNQSTTPFKKLQLVYEGAEDPLKQVFREHTVWVPKRFIHRWSLYQDGKKVGIYAVKEGEAGSYGLFIGSEAVSAIPIS